MKKFPALQPYAKKPYTSYIVYLAVALPLSVIVLPILGAIVGFLTGTLSSLNVCELVIAQVSVFSGDTAWLLDK